MKKQFILPAMLLASCATAFGQVGIGTENPHTSSILELKSTKSGFLPPRMTEIQRDAIASPAEGLIIYNLTEHCLNLWNSSLWKSLCNVGNTVDPSTNGTGKATYDCNAGTSTGTLTVGTPANGVSKVIVVTVTQLGTYSISASANGITYTAGGTFTALGSQNITLTAIGTPTTAGANISFSLNTNPSCAFNKAINAAAPSFSILSCQDSGSTVGWLAKGLPANSADIQAQQVIQVNVIQPGNYSFSTNNVNGVQFTASGTFTATGTQSVTLNATGTPVNYTVDNNSISYIINGASNACSFTRNVYLPDQNYTGSIRNTNNKHRFLYKIITGPNNNEWLATNLGAHYNQVGHPSFNPEAAAANENDYLAYGSLFQAGKNSDGHELVTWTSSTSATQLSATTSTFTSPPTESLSDLANDGLYYVTTDLNKQHGVKSLNTIIGRFFVGPGNPCPTGFVNSQQEDFGGNYNAGTAYWSSSTLKLVAPAVYRSAVDGAITVYSRRLLRGNSLGVFPSGIASSAEFVISGGSLITGSTYWDRRVLENGNSDRRGSLDGYPVRCVKP